MINPIDYIHKYPHRSKQILGISYKQFLQLVQHASLHQSQERQRIEQTKMRVNAPGGEENQFYQPRLRLVYVYFTYDIYQRLKF